MPPNATGTEGLTGNQLDPKAAETALAKANRDRQAFGLPEKSQGDPAAQSKKSETDDKTPDPAKAKAVDGKSDVKADTDIGTGYKWLGKYETPEALEAAAREKDKVIQARETEAETLRQEKLALEGELSKLKAGTKPPEGTAKDGAGKDGDAGKTDLKSATKIDIGKLLEDDPTAKALLRDIEEASGPEVKKAMIGLLKLVAANSQPAKAEDDRLARLEEAQLEREQERRIDDLVKRRPELEDNEPLQKKFEELTDLAIKSAHDQNFLLELILDAAIGRMAPDFIERGIITRVKKLTKAEKDKILAGGTTSDGSAPGATGGGRTTDDKTDRNYQAWGMKRPGSA